MAGPGDVWVDVPVVFGTNTFAPETLLEHFEGTAWWLVNAPGVSPSITQIGRQDQRSSDTRLASAVLRWFERRVGAWDPA